MEWLSIPVFLSGESHGQRSLAGYSPWGCAESDRTERPTLSLFTAMSLGGGAYHPWKVTLYPRHSIPSPLK